MRLIGCRGLWDVAGGVWSAARFGTWLVGLALTLREWWADRPRRKAVARARADARRKFWSECHGESVDFGPPLGGGEMCFRMDCRWPDGDCAAQVAQDAYYGELLVSRGLSETPPWA